MTFLAYYFRHVLSISSDKTPLRSDSKLYNSYLDKNIESSGSYSKLEVICSNDNETGIQLPSSQFYIRTFLHACILWKVNGSFHMYRMENVASRYR